MRAVIQRVSSASVTVDDEVVSKISRGLMVLVGIGSEQMILPPTSLPRLKKCVSTSSVYIHESINSELAPFARSFPRSLGLRIFSDPTDPKKMWKASVKDIEGEILCVSQFTLLANTTKDKPDFHLAMSADPARELYGAFLDMLREAYVPERIKDGKFGAMMNVSLTNDGPVTFTIDSRKYQYVGHSGGNGVRNVNANVKGGGKSKKGPAPSTVAETP